jgi:hypothetical protein
MEALERANDIRTKRANFKKQMKAAPTKPKSAEKCVEAILDPPWHMETMKVYDLLLATRGFGKVKANKYLVRLRISPSKTLGGLSARQRAEIAGAVRDGLD